jgi:hypothetical protein
MGAKDDHHRHLLAGDPREFACAVADFGSAIGAALEAVLSGDPLEQPLTTFLRLHVAHSCAVRTAVAVSDMREDEPQTQIVAEPCGDGDRLGGTGGLVNSTQDGFHHRLPQQRLSEHSIGRAAPRRNR